MTSSPHWNKHKTSRVLLNIASNLLGSTQVCQSLNRNKSRTGFGVLLPLWLLSTGAMAPWLRARGQWWSTLWRWVGRWHQSLHWKRIPFVTSLIANLRVLDVNEEMWRWSYLYSHTGSLCPRSHLMVGIMDTGASFQCKSLNREHQIRRIGSNKRKEFNFLFECSAPI